jgi:hypothetical protein
MINIDLTNPIHTNDCVNMFYPILISTTFLSDSSFCFTMLFIGTIYFYFIHFKLLAFIRTLFKEYFEKFLLIVLSYNKI